MTDSHDLNRFVKAQDGVYPRALAEIQNGRKMSHWMWFIFPQIDGLGFSPTSKHYAIKSLDEARAYLVDPTLGPRLRECAEAMLRIRKRTASEILGSPDDLKLQSSMTLFASISRPNSVFEQVLDKYYAGVRDGRTIQIVGV